jgi:hypothetical protein
MMIVANWNQLDAAWLSVSFNGVFAIGQIIGVLTYVPDSPSEMIMKGRD